MSASRCRICIQQNASVYLFYPDEEINYGSKVKQCTGLEISENDCLPHSICVDCLSELEITYEFIIKCRSSDKRLRADLDLDLTSTVLKTQLKTEDADNRSDNDEIDFDDGAGLPNKNIEKKTVTKVLVSKHCKNEPRKRRKKVKTGPIACTTCGLTANSHSAMKIHMRKHTGEKPFICGSCDSRYSSKGLLKRHIETSHMKRERKFICETCSSSFYSKNDLMNHLRLHLNEKPFNCKYCNRGFTQTSSLIRHSRLHTGDKPFVCVTCQKTFSDKSCLTKHLLVHSDEKKYSCHLCNKSLKSLYSLKIHISALHSNERLNVCNFCGASFNLKGNLKTHIDRVHSEKSGECKICCKTFSDLDAHMRRHTGEKPFLCEFCNKSFSVRGGLTHHILFKHKNINKFRCSVADCQQTFPMGSMLEYHILKYHTNQTPFTCQHCSRGFFRSSDLSRHLRGSHMELSTHAKLPMPLKMEVC